MNIPGKFLTRFGHERFTTLGSLSTFFAQVLGSDFPTWFNAKVANRDEWTGLMLLGAPTFTNFNSFWSALLAHRPFSLIEVLAYTSAIANETAGKFRPISETYNGPAGMHPGIAYLFDSFVVHTPNGNFQKASYNGGHNRSAGVLFRDADFNRAHATKVLGDVLAGTTDAVWDGETYPKERYPTSGLGNDMGYILEADFFKFRGRGLIQSTWRPAYRALVTFVQNYAGAQSVVLQYKQRWAGQDPDLICTTSSTTDWDALFQTTDLVVACAALQQHAEALHYMPLSDDPAVANGTGQGSVAFMGRSLRGDTEYGLLLRSRVARIADAMIATAPAAGAPKLFALLDLPFARHVAMSPLAMPLAGLLQQPDLIRRMQQALGDIGLLDPPVDGVWGPVSGWALRAFCAMSGISWNGSLNGDMLDRLEAMAARAGGNDAVFPLRPGTDFAGRVISAMLTAGHWVTRHPECLNIVYVEGCGPDGTPNDNAPNQFNDARLLIRIDSAGTPVLVGGWQATTEPGKQFTLQPVPGVAAAARIAFGQYKAWQVGLHHGTMEALIQSAEIDIYRDFAKDYKREGPVLHGFYGINQHGGYDYPYGDIRDASAGCLVGRLMSGHTAFMQLVKTDRRYQNGNGYTFMTTVMPAAAVVG